jgi:hypothetical protein
MVGKSTIAVYPQYIPIDVMGEIERENEVRLGRNHIFVRWESHGRALDVSAAVCMCC